MLICLVAFIMEKMGFIDKIPEDIICDDYEEVVLVA